MSLTRPPNSILGQMPANTVKGNNTGSTADASDLSTGTVTESTSSVLTLNSWSNATIGSPTITVKQANTSQSGYLSSTDWNTFNNKQSTLTLGNLTDVGTDGITVTGGSGAVVGSGTSISQHVADSTHNGYLSSTDWSTFNNKQSTLTLGNLTDVGTDGITVTGGTGSVVGSGTSISQHVADSTHNGYLSSTDWSTFNNKQSTLSLGTVTESTSSVLTLTGWSSATVGSPTITVKQASTSQSGYLSSTDWNTFNNKQAAITFPLAIGSGGSGQTTANAALNAFLPSQTSNTGKFLTTDGSNSSWASVPSNPVTTKGDLATYDTAVARLPVGTNGQILKADSTAATGLAWTDSVTGKTFTSNTIISGGRLLVQAGTNNQVLYAQGGATDGGNYLAFYNNAGTNLQQFMNLAADGSYTFSSGAASNKVASLSNNGNGGQLLILNNAGTNQLQLDYNGSATRVLSFAAGSLQFGTLVNQNIEFYVNSAVKMYMTPAGAVNVTNNLGIGRATNTILDVYGAHSGGPYGMLNLESTGTECAVQFVKNSGTARSVKLGLDNSGNLFIHDGVDYRMQIPVGGQVKFNAIHNNAGGATGTTPLIASGTYTPTNVGSNTNIATITVHGAQWMRCGNVVTVSGQLNVTLNSAGTGIQTNFRLSLPIATTIAQQGRNLNGVCVPIGTVSGKFAIYGASDVSPNAALFDGSLSTTGDLHYTYTYEVR